MRKYTFEEKVQIVQGYLNGNYSLSEKARELGYKDVPGCFRRWVHIYRVQGECGLLPSNKNHHYTKEFKKKVVEEYYQENVTIYELIAKYKISSDSVLSDWIKLYNANKELKDYCPNPEVYMAEARRKTTIEERKEIVEYCIEHNRNYKETAAKYDVSYSQVYDWVRKYDQSGDEGLIDKRGHHKTDDEVDELERLRRENLRLKKQLKEQEMINQLLKKVQEFERM